MPYMDAIRFIGCSFGFEMMNDFKFTNGLETNMSLAGKSIVAPCYVSLPEALAIPVETFVFENPKKRIFGGIFFRTNHKRKTWKSFFPSNLARLADLSQRKTCISTFVNGRCSILLCENMRENHDFSVIIDFWCVGLNNHAIFLIFG